MKIKLWQWEYEFDKDDAKIVVPLILMLLGLTLTQLRKDALLPGAVAYYLLYCFLPPWRVAQAFDLAGITNTGGAPSFAFLAKGGHHERIRNGVCAERTKVASAASLPAPSTSSGQALAQNARTGHPRAQLPAVIRTHQ
jgi:hypothetical protein